MSISRSNIILAVVLVVQLGIVGLVFFANEEETSAPLGRGGELVADFEPNEYDTMIIEDDDGNLIVIALVDGLWALPSADDFPVQDQRVVSALDTVEGLQADQLVTRSANTHRRLQVADDTFFRKVTLQGDGQEVILYIGSAGGGNTRHVRISGEEAVYLTDDIPTGQFEAFTSSWVNTTYFSIAPDTIVGLSIENESGTYVIAANDEGVLTLEGLAPNRITNAAQLNPILQGFGTFRLLDPLGTEEDEAWGFAEPTAVVTISVEVPAEEDATTTDEDPSSDDDPDAVETVSESYTLTIGAAAEDESGYYAKYSDSEYYVLISNTVAERFINASEETLATDQLFAIFGG